MTTTYTLRTWIPGNPESSTDPRDMTYHLTSEDALDQAERLPDDTCWSVREGYSRSGRLVRESVGVE